MSVEDVIPITMANGEAITFKGSDPVFKLYGLLRYKLHVYVVHYLFVVPTRCVNKHHRGYACFRIDS